MLCKKMVESKGTVHPCGQCLFCRINYKREWLSRMLLEAACHEINQFWTLTYEQDQLFPSSAFPGSVHFPEQVDSAARRQPGGLPVIAAQPGSLFPPDLTRFFKRARKHGFRFRYFAVGEYGEKRGRPHFHVLAFGLSAPFDVDTLSRLWGHGSCHIGSVESHSIQYCIEYSMKAKEKGLDLVNARRFPEYSVQSSNPGIGAYALAELRSAVLRAGPLPSGVYVIPDTFRVLGRELPFPRYLSRMLEDEGFETARFALQRARATHDAPDLSALLGRSPLASRLYRQAELLISDPRGSAESRLQKVLNAGRRQQIFGVRHETL